MSTRPSYHALFAFALATVFLVVFSIPYVRATAPVDEIRSKISERNKVIEDLEKEIREYKEQLTSIDGKAKTLKNSLQSLTLNKKKVETDISLTENNIEKTSFTLEELEIDIVQKENLISNKTQTIARSLREMDEQENQSIIEIMLANENLSDFWNSIENLRQFQNKMKSDLAVLRNLKVKAEEQHTQVLEEQSRLASLKDQLGDKHRLLQENTKEQAELLSETKEQEKSYKQLLAEKQEKRDAFQSELEELENELKIALDPSKLPSTGTEALQWPLKGSIQLTQKFGRTADSGRLYASGTHNGIDIRASRGTPLYAAGSGKVIGTGDTDLTCKWASYGRWILIEHTNGLSTLYAHLDLIKVGKGDMVSSGQLIGYTGNTGYSTGPHLHFTVFASEGVEVRQLQSKSCTGAVYTIPIAAKNAYLNPEQYLQ